jgi:hypothetical protein
MDVPSIESVDGELFPTEKARTISRRSESTESSESSYKQ